MRGRFGAVWLGLIGAALLVALVVTPEPARAVNYLYFSIALSGNGSGAWQTLDSYNGNPDGNIDCHMVDGSVDPREICSQQYDLGTDTKITLYYRITPAPGSCNTTFGSCSGIYNGTKIVTIDETDTASFAKASGILYMTMQGSGTVTSSPSGMDCDSGCFHDFGYGVTVTLTGTPAPGWQLQSWSGCGSVTAGKCVIKLAAQAFVSVTFTALPTAPPPTPGPSPTPQQTTAPKPTATPRATATVGPGGSPPAGSPAAGSPVPGSTSSDTGPTPEAASPGAASPASSAVGPGSASAGPGGPGTPAGNSGPDQTGIILAILGAGLLIAIAIGAVGVAIVRGKGGNRGSAGSSS